ncbi:MAG: hypothetical protein Q8R87_00055 [Anaerolineaceae bacterium]|nr:hypothetical protein [Anaerolineaceae bacterium]
MKKGINIIFATCIILLIGFVNAPKTVEAKDTKVAEGVWNTGTEVDVDATVPESLNLLTKGVKVTKPGLICHPFRGGQYHWVGEIHQLKNGNWVKLKTTNDWYPDKEGQFMACAQAPSAGTYALFGYYNGPLETAGDYSFDCSTVVWDAIILTFVEQPVDLPTHYFWPRFNNVPFGTPVTYKVTSIIPENIISGSLNGYGTIGENGFVFFGMDQLTKSPEDPMPMITVDFSFLGCTFTKVFSASNNP